GRAARLHAPNADAMIDREVELLRKGRRDLLDCNAEKATLDAALIDYLLDDRLGSLHRDRQADALGVLGASADYRSGDAHDLAVEVDERAARVAGINSGVRLDGVRNRDVLLLDETVERADDALGDGWPAREVERVADGDYVIADFELRGITERGRLQVAAVNLEDGHIGRRVPAGDLRLVLASLVERHRDVLSSVATVGADHMIVRDDVSFVVDDESRADAGAGHEPAEVIEGRRLALDVDDGRAQEL